MFRFINRLLFTEYLSFRRYKKRNLTNIFVARLISDTQLFLSIKKIQNITQKNFRLENFVSFLTYHTSMEPDLANESDRYTATNRWIRLNFKVRNFHRWIFQKNFKNLHLQWRCDDRWWLEFWQKWHLKCHFGSSFKTT